jgi:hypothetical protein
MTSAGTARGFFITKTRPFILFFSLYEVPDGDEEGIHRNRNWLATVEMRADPDHVNRAGRELRDV